jgi:hypothetical protein
MSDKAKSEKYYLTNDYFKIIQDAWDNFAVNYHKTYMQMTESNFDLLCTLFCDSVNPTMHNMAKEYVKQLEEQERQQRE